uniref:Uncharacterized protein n=1 Tax=Lotus japonicus TaxID=34305 RepID=I3SLN8_LOTJA|nr:unknown [Lotus japonicus]
MTMKRSQMSSKGSNSGGLHTTASINHSHFHSSLLQMRRGSLDSLSTNGTVISSLLLTSNMYWMKARKLH